MGKNHLNPAKGNLSFTDIDAAQRLKHFTCKHGWKEVKNILTNKGNNSTLPHPEIIATKLTTHAPTEPAIISSKLATYKHTVPFIPPTKFTPPETDNTANNTPTEDEVVHICCKTMIGKGERKINCENPANIKILAKSARNYCVE